MTQSVSGAKSGTALLCPAFLFLSPSHLFSSPPPPPSSCRRTHIYAVYAAASSTCHAYVWDERTGKRSVNEMLSVLWRHIQEQRAPPSATSATAASTSSAAGSAGAGSQVAGSGSGAGQTAAAPGVGAVPTPAPVEPKRSPWLIGLHVLSL
jgi:hypothetical protein